MRKLNIDRPARLFAKLRAITNTDRRRSDA
jgi:hypothetical protein